MATAPTAGYIYLIEAAGDLGAKTNWITAGSGDPDTIDIEQFTEGLTYCKIEMPEMFRKSFVTGITVEDGGGGISFDRRFERRAYAILASGISTTRANGDKVEQFCMAPRHTSGSSAVYKNYYLIFYFAVNDHGPFTDASGNRKSYCKGAVLNGSIIWNKSNPLLYTIKLNWRSVW